MNYGFCIKSRSSPLVWCPDDDGSSAPVCSVDDIDLLTNLASWWRLTDAGALSDTDHGYLEHHLDHSGAPPTYDADNGRGDMIGAAAFAAGTPAFFVYDDRSSVDYNVPQTFVVWVKLSEFAGSGTILYYGDATTNYELRYSSSLQRFIWIVNGNASSGIVVGNNGGQVVSGTWYLLEASYEDGLASLRVMASRTAEDTPVEISADIATVPGGAIETPGQLLIGYGTSILEGLIGGVGFFTHGLNVCELGRLNFPSDFPFIKGAHLSEYGDAEMGEGGDFRVGEGF